MAAPGRGRLRKALARIIPGKWSASALAAAVTHLRKHS